MKFTLSIATIIMVAWTMTLFFGFVTMSVMCQWIPVGFTFATVLILWGTAVIFLGKRIEWV